MIENLKNVGDRREYFEAENYLSPTEGYPERPVSWFKETILPDVLHEHKEKSHLLDVGCAFGYYTNEFKDSFESVTGIDYARNRISFATENFETDTLKFVNTKIEEFNTDKRFDAMFTSMVIQHIPLENKIPAFKNLHSIAADDCLFLLYDFNSNTKNLNGSFVLPNPEVTNKLFPFIS